MQLFYAPDLTTQPVALPEDEAKHCTRVLRKQVGDMINVTDGKGGIWEAEIVVADKRECMVSLRDQLPDPMPRPYHLTMCVATARNTERFEWFIEKATELGVDRIIPMSTARTERARYKRDRLERILLSAMKQSGRAVLPVLDEIKPFADVIKELGKTPIDQAFVAVCFGDDKQHLGNVYEKGRNVVIFIGPEGDLTEQEAEAAIGLGCVPISLGPARLRLETAAVAACHIINLKNEQ